MARVPRRKTHPTHERDVDGDTEGDEDGPEQEMQPLMATRRNNAQSVVLETGKEATTKTAVVRLRTIEEEHTRKRNETGLTQKDERNRRRTKRENHDEDLRARDDVLLVHQQRRKSAAKDAWRACGIGLPLGRSGRSRVRT